MKKILIVCVLSLICSLSFAQTDESLTDTSMIVGVLKEETLVGESVSNLCMEDGYKFLPQKSWILVAGVIKCSLPTLNPTYFYKIAVKDKFYFVEKDKLLVKEGTYEFISSLSGDRMEKLSIAALKLSNELHQGGLKQSLKFLNDCKPKGLSVLKFSYYDESGYTNGTSCSVEVYNPTSKVIKYIWFSFSGYNPVGDKVIDPKRKTGSITMKAVGPIKAKGIGSYDFEYVWFTDLVETAKITNIKVQYMDGTFKTIVSPKEITLKKDLYSFIVEDEE